MRQPVARASSTASSSECRSVIEYMRVSMAAGLPIAAASRHSASISAIDAPGV